MQFSFVVMVKKQIYVACFNLKHNRYDIIDNSDENITLEKKYVGVPEELVNYFTQTSIYFISYYYVLISLYYSNICSCVSCSNTKWSGKQIKWRR